MVIQAQPGDLVKMVKPPPHPSAFDAHTYQHTRTIHQRESMLWHATDTVLDLEHRQWAHDTCCNTRNQRLFTCESRVEAHTCMLQDPRHRFTLPRNHDIQVAEGLALVQGTPASETVVLL